MTALSSRFSTILSVVFHPVFVNALSMWLLFLLYPNLYYVIPPVVKWFYLGFVFIIAGIVPLIVVLVNSYFNNKKSILLHEKEDRNFPYMVTAIAYLFVFYFAKKIGAPSVLIAYLLGCSSVVVCVLIVNLFTKISIHAASLGAMVAVILCATFLTTMDIRIMLSIAILISGLVLSARLFLNAHSLTQVYSGFFAGFFIMWFIL